MVCGRRIITLCIAFDILAFVVSTRQFSAFVKPSTLSIAKSRSQSSVCRATTLKRKESEDEDDDSPPLPWPPLDARQKDYSLGKGEVAVRFINAPGRSPSNGKNDVSCSCAVFEILFLMLSVRLAGNCRRSPGGYSNCRCGLCWYPHTSRLHDWAVRRLHVRHGGPIFPRKSRHPARMLHPGKSDIQLPIEVSRMSRSF